MTTGRINQVASRQDREPREPPGVAARGVRVELAATRPGPDARVRPRRRRRRRLLRLRRRLARARLRESSTLGRCAPSLRPPRRICQRRRIRISVVETDRRRARPTWTDVARTSYTNRLRVQSQPAALSQPTCLQTDPGTGGGEERGTLAPTSPAASVGRTRTWTSSRRAGRPCLFYTPIVNRLPERSLRTRPGEGNDATTLVDRSSPDPERRRRIRTRLPCLPVDRVKESRKPLDRAAAKLPCVTDPSTPGETGDR